MRYKKFLLSTMVSVLCLGLLSGADIKMRFQYMMRRYAYYLE